MLSRSASNQIGHTVFGDGYLDPENTLARRPDYSGEFTTQLTTGLGFMTAVTVIGLWSAPKLIAAVKAALVQNVDEPGRNPYQEGKSTSCPFPGDCVTTFSSVPAGTRLVLTSVSGIIRTTNLLEKRSSGFYLLEEIRSVTASGRGRLGIFRKDTVIVGRINCAGAFAWAMAISMIVFTLGMWHYAIPRTPESSRRSFGLRLAPAVLVPN